MNSGNRTSKERLAVLEQQCVAMRAELTSIKKILWVLSGGILAQVGLATGIAW